MDICTEEEENGQKCIWWCKCDILTKLYWNPCYLFILDHPVCGFCFLLHFGGLELWCGAFYPALIFKPCRRQWEVVVLNCTLVNYVKLLLLAHWHGLLSDVIVSLTELCATEILTVATLGQLHVLVLVTYMWYILSHIPCGDILKV